MKIHGGFLLFVVLSTLIQGLMADFLQTRRRQTFSMIDNWKRERLNNHDPEVFKIHEWFRDGCTRSGLKPKSVKRVVRQEYRTLTWNQRYLFHACLKAMLETPAVSPYWNQNEYESFVTMHKFQFSPEAHGAASFTPYHRVLLYFFEKVMHSHPGCEKVGIPYWDSTLDSYLPDPSMSAMFGGSTYMGTTHGKVEGELFKKWQNITIQSCEFYGESLTREMCRDPDQMLKDSMIERFMNCHNYTACVYPVDKTFEENHGLMHGCIKGHMAELLCAPYDPLFWLHHAFIDYIFEEWLRKHYPDVRKDDPTAAYPPDESFESYFNKGGQPMRPFDKSGYKVKDGMSRNFTRDFYRYSPRPHHCTSDKDCKSKLLWCDVAKRRCKAKAAEGASCRGLPDVACYCRMNSLARCIKPEEICACHSSEIVKKSFLDVGSVMKSSLSEPPSDNLIPSTPIPEASTLPPTTQEPSQTTLKPQPPTQEPVTKPQLAADKYFTAQQPLLDPTKKAQKECRGSEECVADEWCDGGVCGMKVGLGGECGSLPDEACSASTTIDPHHPPQHCRDDLEEVKCINGKCLCAEKKIPCALRRRKPCPENMFCSMRDQLCVVKSKPGWRCDVDKPFDSCGFCVEGWRGICTRRNGRCSCFRSQTWFSQMEV